MPQWHQAQTELDDAKGTRCPQFDMNISSVLTALSQRDTERISYRTQVLEAHVNLAVWRDQYTGVCGAVRSRVEVFRVSPDDAKFVSSKKKACVFVLLLNMFVLLA